VLLNPRPCAIPFTPPNPASRRFRFSPARHGHGEIRRRITIGSLALISEALHSSVDVIATVVTWMVVRVSDLPADKEHHYGHGKLESLSALGVIAMLYVLAGGILVESYSRLHEGAPPPTLSAIPFIVLLLDIAVNFWRAARCNAPRTRPGARHWPPTRCISDRTCSDRSLSLSDLRFPASVTPGAMPPPRSAWPS